MGGRVVHWIDCFNSEFALLFTRVDGLNEMISISHLTSVDQWGDRASFDTCNTASIIVGLEVVGGVHQGDFVFEEDTSSLRAGVITGFTSLRERKGFDCNCAAGSL